MWVHYLVDDIRQQLQPDLHRPGPAPTTCSDNKLMAMAIIGQGRGYDMATELLTFWSEQRDLFPAGLPRAASSGATAP